MAPRWPQVNNGPEHINEHATYLREVCNQLQAADRGRTNQIPWHIVQAYLESTLALIGKVLQRPSVGEVFHHIQDAANDIQTIRRDVTAAKSSIGLSTTPLNASYFSGVRTHGHRGPKSQHKAKAPRYHHHHHHQHQDRVVTVKLQNYRIVQRFRNYPVTWTKQKVQTSIRDNTLTKAIKLVAAHQLKSGDLQIFTSTSGEAQQLKQNTGWLKGLADQAEVFVPTYGVIVHGISTKSMNIKDQNATIQQMLADNYTVIPDAKISYVGWLTREGPLKRASSIVVEFAAPEMANAVIYAGMVWEGQIHQCQLYDRTCRVRQCFRCSHYGHIGAQCNASQTRGYCAELHEAKHCRQKEVEGFTPRCPVCKGAHTAWSNACPARKKELERVEQAKQNRSIEWHVPARDHTTRPRRESTNNVPNLQETALSINPVPTPTVSTQTRTQTLMECRATKAAQTLGQATSSTDHMTNQPGRYVEIPAPTQAPVEEIATQALL
ncbi:hypothetical protein PV08_11875 [Exophiala spinifera]|uniref:CCHC-type domain-containing protein n=1 Tax=Exophiala spinifera TaxID=91928 RepID=A0A0D2ATC5_9EURO|nr:uncharacterized protein PV08_11875 [Exophiala spinifera]KIW09775.1 hypothetical protein PV08_11875 [Exophiala spinifera]